MDTRNLVRMGLLAGVFTLYTAIIGMLETFSEREIIRDVVTLGQLLLVIAPLAAGLLVARRAHSTNQRPLSLLFAGGIVGVIASLPLLVLIFLGNQLDLRPILVNITRDLMEILTFDQDSTLVGSLLLSATFVVFGLLGAGVYVIPERPRRILLTGLIWMFGIGIMSQFSKLILGQIFTGRDALNAFFRRDTLTVTGAVVVFVIAAGSELFWSTQGKHVRQRIQSLPGSRQRVLRRGGFSVLGLLLLLLPWLVGTFLAEVLSNVGLFILMGLGLNIAVGLAGLLDLGYVTNFAVGAYVMGILTSTGLLGIDEKTGIGIFNFWLVLPISLLAAMLTGFILAVPVLRMRGDYLAIATLGFGEIIRLLALSDWLKPVIGGAQGVLFIPKPEIFGFILNEPQQIYYVILAACLLALFVSTRLNNSRTGRQWMALREDEDVAAAMGINTARAKLLAFTISAATGGLAGAIFAAKLGTIFPSSFNLLISINVLSLIIVGGMGSTPGIVLGALVLVGMPELLREFSEFRLLIYGALLIVMMLSRPAGLWPSAVHRREMRQDEPEPDSQPRVEKPVIATGD
jgi:branched-chain amino acid transport system permease protein